MAIFSPQKNERGGREVAPVRQRPGQQQAIKTSVPAAEDFLAAKRVYWVTPIFDTPYAEFQKPPSVTLPVTRGHAHIIIYLHVYLCIHVYFK